VNILMYIHVLLRQGVLLRSVFILPVVVYSSLLSTYTYGIM